MGYQQIEIPEGYSLFTVTFKDITETTFDIQNIIPYDADGVEIASNSKIMLQKMDDTGTYLTTYNYRKGRGGWCAGNTLVEAGTVTLKDGEAVCLNNKYGSVIKVQISGQVELRPQTTLAKGYSLVGNMTPATIDLQDMIPYDLDGNEIALNSKVMIQKMDSDGAYLTTYNYRKSRGGWCAGNTLIETGDVTFTPGEAFCLNNKYDTAIVLKFKSPIAQ